MDENLTVNIPHEVTGSEAPTTTPADETSPRKFGGEFDTVEELEARYRELVSSVNATSQQPEPQPAPQDTPPAPANDQATAATAKEAQALLNGKGLDVNAFEQEFGEKGELSAESYEKLAAAGFNKEVVDRYIQANTIIMDKLVTDMQAIAGGAEGYAAMSEWARTHLDTREIEAFNKATASGDMEMIRFAVSGLHARYQAAEGKAPDLVRGKAGSSGGGASTSVFRSSAEVVSAMRDPRYGKDSAYTREIEQKMARSDVF